VGKYKVMLSFVFEGTEDEAWDVAEALERGAMHKNYRQASGYIESADGRPLVAEGENVQMTSAETLSRETSGGFGMEGITLGGESGRQSG